MLKIDISDNMVAAGNIIPRGKFSNYAVSEGVQLHFSRKKLGGRRRLFDLTFWTKPLSPLPTFEDNAAQKQPPPFAWTHHTPTAPSCGVVCHLEIICSLLR